MVLEDARSNSVQSCTEYGHGELKATVIVCQILKDGILSTCCNVIFLLVARHGVFKQHKLKKQSDVILV